MMTFVLPMLLAAASSVSPAAAPPALHVTKPIPLSTKLPGSLMGGGQIAWSGKEYLVVWNHEGAVMATRVDPSGRVLDDPPILVDPRGGVRGVTYDGTNFLAVYVEGGDGTRYGSFLHGRRLSAAGNELRVLDESPILISQAEFPLSGWIFDA